MLPACFELNLALSNIFYYQLAGYGPGPGVTASGIKRDLTAFLKVSMTLMTHCHWI
jgi:hypothetical protein